MLRRAGQGGPGGRRAPRGARALQDALRGQVPRRHGALLHQREPRVPARQLRVQVPEEGGAEAAGGDAEDAALPARVHRGPPHGGLQEGHAGQAPRGPLRRVPQLPVRQRARGPGQDVPARRLHPRVLRAPQGGPPEPHRAQRPRQHRQVRRRRQQRPQGLHTNHLAGVQDVPPAGADGLPQRLWVRGGPRQGVRPVHQQERGDAAGQHDGQVLGAAGQVLRQPAQEGHQARGGRGDRGPAQRRHDHIHLHRGQGRLPALLQQHAGQAARLPGVGQRRRGVLYDIQAQAGLRLRVHVQTAADVPGHGHLQGAQRQLQEVRQGQRRRRLRAGRGLQRARAVVGLLALPAVQPVRHTRALCPQHGDIHVLLHQPAQRAQAQLALLAVQGRPHSALLRQPLHLPGVHLPDGHPTAVQHAGQLHGSAAPRGHADKRGPPAPGAQDAGQDQDPPPHVRGRLRGRGARVLGLRVEQGVQEQEALRQHQRAAQGPGQVGAGEDAQGRGGGPQAAHPGGHRQGHEDQEGAQAPAARGRGAQAVLVAVQAQHSRHQEVHRHTHRKGVPREGRRTEGHLQLPRVSTKCPPTNVLNSHNFGLKGEESVKL